MTSWYPAIAEDHILLLSPAGGELLDLAGRLDVGRQRKRMTVNGSAAVFLSCLDGRTEIVDILQSIKSRLADQSSAEIDETLRDFLAFLASLQDQDAVEINTEPTDRSHRITGDFRRNTPQNVTIELTDHCNLICRHCYRNSGPGMKNFLATESVLEAMEDFYRLGVKSVELTGGEPTTHPGFETILEAALERFPLVAVITNGTNLSDRVLAALNRPNALTQIDFDGVDAETHNFLRGTPFAYDSVQATAKKLQAWGVRYRVAMCVHRGNLDQVEAVADKALALGATWFGASPIIDVGRGATSVETLDLDQVRHLMTVLTKLKDRTPTGFIKLEEQIVQDHQTVSEQNCGAGSRTVAVSPKGDIRPCAMYDQKYLSLGNIHETRVRDVFADEAVSTFMGLPAPQPAICGDCRMLTFCGGCFARPPVAFERARNAGKPVDCRWAEHTRFARLLNRRNPFPAVSAA